MGSRPHAPFVVAALGGVALVARLRAHLRVLAAATPTHQTVPATANLIPLA
jgi:hypothetical protein